MRSKLHAMIPFVLMAGAYGAPDLSISRIPDTYSEPLRSDRCKQELIDKAEAKRQRKAQKLREIEARRKV